MSLFQRHVSSRVVDYAWAYRRRFDALRKRDPDEYRVGDLRPVLILPGVYESWHFLEAAARRLSAAGHPVHVVPTFGRNLRPIPDMAELARSYVVQADLTDVLVVAHSKGGLIGKTLMLTPDGERRVSSMVAINSPFGGSDYARLVPIRTLREFVPTHATIRSLNANAEVNSRIVSIFSSWDPIIPNSSLLDGATNLELPITGHFRILDNPELLDAVVEIAGATPAGG